MNEWSMALMSRCPCKGDCDGRVVRWSGQIPTCAKCGANWISGVKDPQWHPRRNTEQPAAGAKQ